MFRSNSIDPDDISNFSHSPEGAIRNVLTAHELDLLARYVGCNHTQAQIGLENRQPQPTVSWQIRKAIRKLAALGVTVPVKGRGRRPKVRAFAMDPAAIERTTATGNNIDGFSVRRWINGREIDQVDDD